MPSRNRHRETLRRTTPTTEPGTAAASDKGAAPTTATSTPTPTRPATGPRRITTPDEAAALAAHLLDANRTRPVVVVSIPSGEAEPWISADDVADAVKDLAEVVVLPTDASSWRFSELMPEMTQVYGGAGRVYPIDLGWTRDPYASLIRVSVERTPSAAP